MTRDQILETLRNNLKSAGLSAETVLVERDPYGAWVVGIVSNGFKGLSPAQRRQEALVGLEKASIEWAELLTPAEAEEFGGLPSQEPAAQLPLWPESLARGVTPSETHFPSDEDEDIDPPVVVTFYSLRGGVGRSTALAHTARLLAAERKKVVCIDMDLEAPGLTALFSREQEVEESQGVVRLLHELDQGEDPDISNHLLKVSEEHNLYVLPAGRVSSDYARRLRLLDPTAWYRESDNPLRALLRKLRTKLPFVPDVLLVDARTGITAMSGPLLFELADIAVITFFPHPQARRGTELIVRGLLSSTTYRDLHPGFTPELRFIASPIPAGRDASVQYERRALEWVSEWLSETNKTRAEDDYIDEREIALTVPYREELATSDSVVGGANADLLFGTVRDWVLRFLPSRKEERTKASLPALKSAVLEDLSFSVGTAETQNDFLANFVQTDVIREATQSQNPLVLGRKGSGKTAIFRWLLESDTVESILVHAPAALRRGRRWLLSSDGFHEAERILREKKLEWRTFWSLYLCAALLNEPEAPASTPDFLDRKSIQTEEGVLDALQRIGDIERGALKPGGWLQQVDSSHDAERLFLFDGLDTGFGNSADDRRRRREAIEGLFGLWMDRVQDLSRLRFKIVLREDIWRQLRFENKSHLYGKSVLLKWGDQPTYFKVVLKQARRATSYGQLLGGRPAGERLLTGSVDDWSNDDVWEAWTVLVGERMKGGKTTFTRNWVWNRLADANDDRTPRHLLQLFHEVVPWERQQHELAPYSRSVIRPRALIKCLDAVSEQALDSLQEEFRELEPLLDRLKQIGRSPVRAEVLDELSELVDLAQEVGLLSVYEEEGEKVQRYRVPDIYRLALGMTRKGQA